MTNEYVRKLADMIVRCGEKINDVSGRLSCVLEKDDKPYELSLNKVAADEYSVVIFDLVDNSYVFFSYIDEKQMQVLVAALNKRLDMLVERERPRIEAERLAKEQKDAEFLDEFTR